MLHEQLKSDTKEALKARDEVRLTTLRGLLAAITNELVSLKRKPDELLEDEVVHTVVKRLVKQRKESIEQFTKGNREDLAEKERAELVVLETYLPAQASREEITNAVADVLAQFPDIDASKSGQIVGMAMKKLNGNADGVLVKEVVEEKLNAQ